MYVDSRGILGKRGGMVSLTGNCSCWNIVAVLSVLLNVWVVFFSSCRAADCPYVFHGTSGVSATRGSEGEKKLPDSLTGCWCGGDEYCLCTPSLAIDTLILDDSNSILLVERSDTGMHALPGGFVEWGETVEDAVMREVHEETNIVLDRARMKLFGVYSDPKRDHRRHTVSAVYVCHVDTSAMRLAKSGDDAKAVVRHSLEEASGLKDLAFDHGEIINDYLAGRTRVVKT